MDNLSQDIYVVLNSVAGMKSAPLEETVGKFLDYVISLPLRIDAKSRCEYARKCANEGTYPTVVGYNDANCPISSSTVKFNTIGEIATKINQIKDAITLHSVEKNITRATNESQSYDDFKARVSKVLSMHDTLIGSNTEELDISPCLYKKDAPVNGIPFGVPELDDMTRGIRRGSLATIGAYTGHGKSTLTESIIYNCARSGLKCLLFTLELPEEDVWAHFESRFDNENGLAVDRENFIFKEMNEDIEDRVIELQPRYLEEVAKNICIMTENKIGVDILKDMLLNPDKMNLFLKGICERLGGLDLVVIDHVNQIELLYPECGNRSIKTFQSSCKSFRNSNNELIAWIMCCQTNRMGWEYAMKHGGQYQLNALAELNEVERSSAYCIFMYTDEEDRNSDNTRICMLKHRHGKLIADPINVPFRPDITTVGGGVSIDLSGSFSSDFSNGFELSSNSIF